MFFPLSRFGRKSSTEVGFLASSEGDSSDVEQVPFFGGKHYFDEFLFFPFAFSGSAFLSGAVADFMLLLVSCGSGFDQGLAGHLGSYVGDACFGGRDGGFAFVPAQHFAFVGAFWVQFILGKQFLRQFC